VERWKDSPADTKENQVGSEVRYTMANNVYLRKKTACTTAFRIRGLTNTTFTIGNIGRLTGETTHVLRCAERLGVWWIRAFLRRRR
jgi:hypothetical protein